MRKFIPTPVSRPDAGGDLWVPADLEGIESGDTPSYDYEVIRLRCAVLNARTVERPYEVAVKERDDALRTVRTLAKARKPFNCYRWPPTGWWQFEVFEPSYPPELLPDKGVIVHKTLSRTLESCRMLIDNETTFRCSYSDEFEGWTLLLPGQLPTTPQPAPEARRE